MPGITGSSVAASALTLPGFGLSAALTSRGVADLATGRSPSIRGVVRGLGPASAPVVMVCALVYGFLFAIGSVLLVLPGIAIAVWLLPFDPVAAIERRDSIWGTLGRAARLVEGSWWYVLATLLVVVTVILVPEIVLGAILVAASDHPSGSYPGAAVSLVWDLVGGTFILVAISVIYLELRVRKEGLTESRLMAELDAGGTPPTDTRPFDAH